MSLNPPGPFLVWFCLWASTCRSRFCWCSHNQLRLGGLVSEDQLLHSGTAGSFSLFLVWRINLRVQLLLWVELQQRNKPLIQRKRRTWKTHSELSSSIKHKKNLVGSVVCRTSSEPCGTISSRAAYRLTNWVSVTELPGFCFCPTWWTEPGLYRKLNSLFLWPLTSDLVSAQRRSVCVPVTCPGLRVRVWNEPTVTTMLLNLKSLYFIKESFVLLIWSNISPKTWLKINRQRGPGPSSVPLGSVSGPNWPVTRTESCWTQTWRTRVSETLLGLVLRLGFRLFLPLLLQQKNNLRQQDVQKLIFPLRKSYKYIFLQSKCSVIYLYSYWAALCRRSLDSGGSFQRQRV